MFHYKRHSSWREIYQKILAKKEPLHTLENFLIAVENNDLRLVNYFLEHGVNPNALDDNFTSALHIASMRGYVNVVKILLAQQTIYINVCDNFNETPLNIACVNNQDAIVEILLDAGADINLPNKNGYSPLHNAVLCKLGNIINLLLKYNPNIDLENCFGKTPLYLSCLDVPNWTITKRLLYHGANINLNNGKIMPILHECCLNCFTAKSTKIIKMLINEFDADVNLKCKFSRRTPLHIVAITNFLPLAEILCEAGADLYILDSEQRTPFDLAVTMDNSDVAIFLYDLVSQATKRIVAL